MTEKLRFSSHTISPGAVEGEALISVEPVLFYKTDSATGIITEKGHVLEGRSVSGKILIFPSGKGSSVVQADGMYCLSRDGTAPKGLIVQELDTVLVSCAIIMEMPMVDRVEREFYETVEDGDTIHIDTNNDIVEVLKKELKNI